MALQSCRATLAAGRHAARSPTTRSSLRPLSTVGSSHKTSERTGYDDVSAPVGRWSQTPPAMKAPMSMNTPKDEVNRVWHVNTSPKRLDDMYDRLLGPGGSALLPNELKWLAVTHKSFDYGRRGFNDRLALLGMAPPLVVAPPPRRGPAPSSWPRAGLADAD